MPADDDLTVNKNVVPRMGTRQWEVMPADDDLTVNKNVVPRMGTRQWEVMPAGDDLARRRPRIPPGRRVAQERRYVCLR